MNLSAAFRWQTASGLVSLSDEAWALFDFPLDSVSSLTDLWQRVHPDDAMSVSQALDRSLRDHTTLDFEHRFLMSDGTVKYVQVIARVVSSNLSGTTNVEYIGTMTDVSGRQRSQHAVANALQEIQAQNIQFRMAVDHIPGLVWSSQANGYVDFLNLRWLEYTGMRLADACGWGWQNALHPDDLPGLMVTWKHLLEAGSAGEVKARLRRYDGSYRWFMFRAIPMYDEGEKLIKWYGQTTDIEDHQRAEALLDREKRLLEMIAKSSPLRHTLNAMCEMVDDMAVGSVSSVWLISLENQRLEQIAGPGIPQSFTDALVREELNSQEGPCGLAAYYRTPVVIQDIANDPRWAAYGEFLVPHGLRACVSTPIFSSTGNVLGTFTLHSKAIGAPTAYQQTIIDHFTHVAALAIERQHGDAALKESEERFRLMAESTPDVIWITDLMPERVLYVSPSFEKLWGHTAADLYRDARLWTKVIHPEDVDRVVAIFAQGKDGYIGTQYDVEFRLLRADGSIRWIHERAVFIRDQAGIAYRVSGISTDITERKLTEDALWASQERFKLAVAASADGIWDWDIGSDALFMSERAQHIYGLQSDLAIRPRLEWCAMMTMHPADEAEHQVLLTNYLSGMAPTIDHECRVVGSDGNFRWIRIRGMCERDMNGRATRLAGSISDIDMHKRTEAALQQARRLQAMGTLAGGIAHDFNNILGVILGYGEMALRDTREGSRQRRDLESIMSAGERGRSLVDRILIFSRSGFSERLPVHVEAVVQETVDLLMPTLPDNIQITLCLTAGRTAMMGDATQVHQLVMNLVTNAAHAMPNGGEIWISLSVRHSQSARVVTTGMLAEGSYLVLEVADSGSGIELEVLDRIFDPFFTTKEVGVGTGLGLSLVHGIVTDVGGAIDVTSTVGKGSFFTVFLPCVGEAALNDVQNAPVLPLGNRQRILVVDDEEPLVRLATETLANLGYLPFPFTSSLSALDAFRATPGAFDAVLTDERMPEMSGSVLIGAVRSVRPSLPIVLMTGYLSETAAKKKYEAVADVVLKKPLSMKDMANGMAQLFT
ncbi:PAS domain-containing protein [Herminiimonas aquatilis]|uniref:histidine kinase n=1 Tax=Herminiimonas aquatilis TaxID=345342 RepID=A0ABW2J8A6_9BURK